MQVVNGHIPIAVLNVRMNLFGKLPTQQMALDFHF